MAVGLSGLPRLEAVPGVRLGAAAAGIRYRDRDDLAVMEIAAGARCAAVFTRNAFRAAPVEVARAHLARAVPRYLLINSGNANAGTGEAGLAAAHECCTALARLGGCAPEHVLPFSTGVIGEPFPADRLIAALPRTLAALDAGGWPAAARAIMTTDTVPKGCTLHFEADGRAHLVTGIVKGSGMIRPDMATLLAFLATDAAVEARTLEDALGAAVQASFNRITVDGDTSTNDACVLVATGAGGGAPITAGGAGYHALCAALADACKRLARATVRDAEGATRFITVAVSEGASESECLRVAYAIAESPLCKTAFFAGDPNWGRILAAVGRAGLDALDLAGVVIHLGDVCIVERGGRAPGYTEAAGQTAMSRDEVTVRVALGRGAASATVWASDLSYEYVKINAEYRS